MKRIKPEEIQNTIRNYVLHRNFSSAVNFIDTTKNEQTNSNSSNKSSKSQLILNHNSINNNNNNTVDLNLMALNELTLIESSITDYYTYSFSSSDRNDYLKQFDLFKNFVKSNQDNDDNTDNDLNQTIFPLFVYLCIDLVKIGFSIKDIVNNYIIQNQSEDLFNKDHRLLIENLLLFDENRDLDKCYYVNKWSENKCKIKLCSKSWKKLLNFLTTSNCHLLLRIFNLNLQIMIGDFIENLEEQIFKSQKNCSNNSNHNVSIKKEKIDTVSEQEKNNASTTLENLKSIIQKVKSQPTKTINSACAFYLDDDQDTQFITSSSISPNLEYLSFTSEQSSIFVYKLNEYESNDRKNQTYFTELVGGHSGAIFKSKFTHDSKYLISCGEDGQACLWDLKNSSTAKCSYAGHLSPVWDVESFSQFNLFATCSKDTTARLWSFDRLYPLRVFCGHQSDVNAVKFHPNGAYMATGSSDKTVRLWSVQTSEFVRLFSGHRSRVFCVAFSPNGYYLASAGEDKKIKIWDLRTGGLYKELKGHTDIIHSISFDNYSEMLCSGGLDRTVKFWDVTTAMTNKSLSTSSSLKMSSSNNDLIKSINVDFSVYSIHCDIQNVFYLSGAIKKPLQRQYQQQHMQMNSLQNIQPSSVRKDVLDLGNNNSSSNNNNGEPNLISMPTQKLKLPINKANCQFVPFSNNHSQDNNNFNKATPTTTTTSQNKNKSLPPTLIVSQTKPTNTQTTISSNYANNLNTKPSINTRRRTAAAAAAASVAAQSQDVQSSFPNETNNANNHLLQDSASYLFNNNDDLYEV